MNKINSTNKALFCDYNVLKDIYEYEIRQLERRNYSLVLLLFEICGTEELSDDVLAQVNETLRMCFLKTLRKGDVFASCSKSKTVVMLIVSNVLDAAKVTNRLCENFKESNDDDKIFLKAETQSSLPE